MATFQASTEEDIDKGFTCSVCLEIYHKPSRVLCGHVFCEKCLTGNSEAGEGHCPLCRERYDVAQVTFDVDMDAMMRNTTGTCTYCGLLMTLMQLSSHKITCRNRRKVPLPKFKPVAPTSQKPLPDVNRSTFACPYCSEKNMDCSMLVKHCNDQHTQAPAHVVCPVCASMPWGDPTLKSGNFLQHLNMRHTFEYETYVDYKADDDAMLEAALKASMKEM